METLSTVLDRKFDYKAVHVGLEVNDDLWRHDVWVVVIEGKTFDYKTGLAYREAKSGMTQLFRDMLGKNLIPTKGNLEKGNVELDKYSKPAKPKLDDVLHSLLLDSMSSEDSFEDFCDQMGYDQDSRKALKIYKEIKANTEKVKEFITDIDSARDSFHDY